ncbi:MAG: tRNA dihydrouridine synthase DusB [Clostridia bacterium]|nr:tRNA dihydrouridine synthase DusB [Clostridia bacterium]
MMDLKGLAILAPMAGFTDSAERRLCSALGADMAITEMISAKAVCFRDEKTGRLARISAGEGAVALQLFGHEPDVMAEAVSVILSGGLPGAYFDHKVCAIDVNMGCPVRKVVSCGDGSALMRTPSLAAEIVRAAADAASPFGVPVTVKIRSGWDKDHVTAPYFASLMVQSGASAVAVHARTRDQMYAPSADLDVIKAVKEQLWEIPVIGNGDITCADDAFYMMEYTGCDSVMIGRAALGDPWIFSEIRARREGRAFSPPTPDERVATALSLIRDVIAEEGEFSGVRAARGRVAHFIRGMRGAAEARDLINHAESYAEIEKIMTERLLARGAGKDET